jgi:uncharacterized membrane protein YdjX (TVP38/TMEM64 family)
LSTIRRNWRLALGAGLVLLAVASFVSSFFVRWNEVLERIQTERNRLAEWVGEQPVLASALYLLGYIAFTGLSLPGAPILTLLGGAVFGVWWGLALVSFGSTTGATLSFLASRYLLRERVQAKYAERLAKVNLELDRGGILYLLALRLNPVIPFFLINLLFGLTRLPVRRFWWVSQLGMLPGTLIYVNAGAQIAEIQSMSAIVSWPVLASLIGLSVFPVLARFVARWLKQDGAPAEVPRREAE